MSDLRTWIDLNDRASGARLKTDTVNGEVFLFIVGLSRNNPRWRQAVQTLGFREAPSQRFLLRALRPDERVLVSDFRKVWPFAALSQMPAEKVRLQIRGALGTQQTEDQSQAHEISAEMANALRLGRNAAGEEVYATAAGRFLLRIADGRVDLVREGSDGQGSGRPADWLRAPDEEALDRCADGVVRSIFMGEVLRSTDVQRFLEAVTGRPAEEQTVEDRDLAHEVIDGACLRALVAGRGTAADAYGDSVMLYEQMPIYSGVGRGAGAVPLPLALLAQRLLGDTTSQRVVVPNAFDGALFSHLAPQTQVHAFRGFKGMRATAAPLRAEALDVQWAETFHHGHHAGAHALIFNADPHLAADGTRKDLRDALLAARSLQPGGRAVLLLAGDDPYQPGALGLASTDFFAYVRQRLVVEEAFEVARELTGTVGTGQTMRVLLLRNEAPSLGEDGQPVQPALGTTLPVCHSWDQCKARVDECIARLAITEAERTGLSATQIKVENTLQRPYIAFSRVGQASTMVPKELQEPLHARLSEVEGLHGPVDAYVSEKLGYEGEHVLVENFSPEQVDAIALVQARFETGRGFILGDDTGIGKGRVIAATISAALQQGRPVIFLTDRSNLFSDLARDLRAIGEWGRARPIVLNADGRIRDIEGDGSVLVEATPPTQLKHMMAQGLDLQAAGANVLFGTYSQISGEDSDKALWVKNVAKGALLILDEAHLASGSDSNTAVVVSELAQTAGQVLYSSATWAKSAQNLFVYARALPESVNVSTLAETMRRGGTAFSEIFSSMLAREGAFLRREHDLSRLDFEVVVDERNRDRNIAVSDRISAVMSSIAFSAGVVRRVVSRASDINVATLRAARDARKQAQSAQLLESRFGTGSMLYVVMRRALAALNADHAADRALEAISKGMKPVVVFEDTGEAFVKAALERELQMTVDEAGEPIGLPADSMGVIKTPGLRDLLRRVLTTLSTVRVREVDLSDLPAIERARGAPGGAAAGEGQPESADEGQAGGNPTDNAAGADEATEAAAAPAPGDAIDAAEVDVAAIARDLATAEPAATDVPVARRRARTRLVNFVDLPDVDDADKSAFLEGLREIERQIDLVPDLPIMVPDVIRWRLEAAGVRVGELSGRSTQLARLAPVDGSGSEQPSLVAVRPRAKGKDVVIQQVRAFNGGDLDAMLLNRSAATGISMHASRRFRDRRRRCLIEIQIPENPTDRQQLYGRVNRFDQETFPLVQVGTTGIHGELRHLMMQNRKLQLLSANARSSRDSHALINSVPDLLTPLGNQICRNFLRDNSELLLKLDIDAEQLEEDVGEVPRLDYASLLTSRAPLLLHKEQEQLYDQVLALYDDALVQAELEGRNPLKPAEMDVRAKVVAQSVMFGLDHRGLGTAFDGAVFAQALSWKETVRPMTLDVVAATVAANRRRLVEDGRLVALGVGSAEAEILRLQLRAHRVVGADAEEGVAHGSMASDSSDEVEVDAALQPPALPAGMPAVRWGAVLDRAIKQLEARARLSIAGTKFKSFDEALYTGLSSLKNNATQRAMAKAKWLERNGPRLIPGTVIEVREKVSRDRDNIGWSTRSMVVLDVRPPKEGRESQLSQWQIVAIEVGRQKAVTLSLATLLQDLELRAEDANGSVPAPGSGLIAMGDQVLVPRFARVAVEGDLFQHQLELARVADRLELAALRGGRSGERGALRERLLEYQSLAYCQLPGAAALRDHIDRSQLGLYQDLRDLAGAREREYRRSAVVLTGNLYLASEWAAQSKLGHGVIFTDESGMRRRGVLLRRDVDIGALAQMPARLWTKDMIRSFFDRVAVGVAEGQLELDDGSLTVYTSFGAARRSNSGQTAGDELRVILGKGLVMNVGKGSRRRIAGILRQAQRRIKEEVFDGDVPRAEDDPEHVVIQIGRSDLAPSARRGSRRRGAAVGEEGDVAVARQPAEALVLRCDTPSKLQRALRMLCEGPGLDIYVTASRLKPIAVDSARDYFLGRLRADALGDEQKLRRIDELVAELQDGDRREAERHAGLLQLLGEYAAPSTQDRSGLQRELDLAVPAEQAQDDAEHIDAPPVMRAA